MQRGPAAGNLIVLACFLDGISMVVLTMGVIMPTVTAAARDGGVACRDQGRSGRGSRRKCYA
jgi:hypothetical protein